MSKYLFIFAITILAGRVAPESKDNSALFPLNTFTELNERNIVMLTEQWKPVKNYEGLYEVSNLGEIKSLPRQWFTGKSKFMMERNCPIILKYSVARTGYRQINLWKDGHYRSVPIHHLVWDAFGDTPRDGMRLQIDHIDGNKENNQIDNLQLLTQRENISKGYEGKRLGHPVGVLYRKDRNKYSAVFWRDGKRNALGYYDTMEEARDRYLKETSF